MIDVEDIPEHAEHVRVLLSDGSTCEGYSGLTHADHIGTADGLFVIYGASVSPLLGEGIENVTVVIPWEKVNMYVVLSEGLPMPSTNVGYD